MPTIKKISLNGTTYELGGGLTEDVKQASLQIAEKVAYIDEHGQDYYDELYTAFYDNMWNVTNTLSNAVNSNSATKTPKDGTYTAIISASTGYTLDGATVSVTMGGANITSSVYNNGTISIPSVTGDVVITVVAVALTVVSISAVYTQTGTVYPTDSLDSLKSDLVVTATYSDSSTEVVPSTNYTLSGTLTAGTSTVTVEYEEQTATFSVVVTERMTLKLSEGDFNIQRGSVSWDTTHDICTNTSNNSLISRRNIYVDSGVKPYYTTPNNTSYVVTDPPQYPIKIPSSATGVKYTVTPSTQYMGVAFYTYDETTNEYTRTDDVGWKQGTNTVTFTAGSKQYLTSAFKYNSTGTTYPTEPTEVVIEFLTS